MEEKPRRSFGRNEFQTVYSPAPLSALERTALKNTIEAKVARRRRWQWVAVPAIAIAMVSCLLLFIVSSPLTLQPNVEEQLTSQTTEENGASHAIPARTKIERTVTSVDDGRVLVGREEAAAWAVELLLADEVELLEEEPEGLLGLMNSAQSDDLPADYQVLASLTEF